ncbi:MAG TPA: AmmeMemoRadiSam system protein A, partial [Nitrospirota bacterium]
MAKGLEGNEDLHPVIQLARDAIEGYLKEGKHISPPEELTPDMREKAGVFVCLKKDGELRGCIGTFQPTTDSIAEEIIQNAVSAATDDPRFNGVEFHELKDIACSVDVLTEPVAVADIKDL